MSLEKKIQFFIGILVVVVLGLAYLGVSQNTIGLVVDLFVKYVIVSAILSTIFGTLLEALTGNVLKEILLNVDIKGIKFSISVFVLTIIVLKLFFSP